MAFWNYPGTNSLTILLVKGQEINTLWVKSMKTALGAYWGSLLVEKPMLTTLLPQFWPSTLLVYIYRYLCFTTPLDGFKYSFMPPRSINLIQCETTGLNRKRRRCKRIIFQNQVIRNLNHFRGTTAAQRIKSNPVFTFISFQTPESINSPLSKKRVKLLDAFALNLIILTVIRKT